MLPGNRVSLFDDEAGPPQKAPSSRGLILKLDLAAGRPRSRPVPPRDRHLGPERGQRAVAIGRQRVRRLRLDAVLLGVLGRRAGCCSTRACRRTTAAIASTASPGRRRPATRPVVAARAQGPEARLGLRELERGHGRGALAGARRPERDLARRSQPPGRLRDAYRRARRFGDHLRGARARREGTHAGDLGPGERRVVSDTSVRHRRRPAAPGRGAVAVRRPPAPAPPPAGGWPPRPRRALLRLRRSVERGRGARPGRAAARPRDVAARPAAVIERGIRGRSRRRAQARYALDDARRLLARPDSRCGDASPAIPEATGVPRRVGRGSATPGAGAHAASASGDADACGSSRRRPVRPRPLRRALARADGGTAPDDWRPRARRPAQRAAHVPPRHLRHARPPGCTASWFFAHDRLRPDRRAPRRSGLDGARSDSAGRLLLLVPQPVLVPRGPARVRPAPTASRSSSSSAA